MGIPLPGFIFITTVVAAYYVMRHSSFGLHTLAIGDNERAAINAGILAKRHKLILYVISGFLAGLAGLIFMARVNAADPNAGTMYELTAITAVIIGGTSLHGGRISIIGVTLGALIMGVLQNGLSLMNVPSYYQPVAIGLILIASVAFANMKGKIVGTA